MRQSDIIEHIVINQIYSIRGEKVMLDFHLAELYQIDNKQLKRQVRRNIERFPEDFMFELTTDEYNSLRSQIGTLKRGQHAKYLPMAFTENGVSMLSSILNSPVAISVNIQIIRIFTRLRNLYSDTNELRLEIERIKNRLNNQDKNMDVVFIYLDELSTKISASEKVIQPRRRIGYKPDPDK